MLLALAVAILPPPHVSKRAVELSAALPPAESHGLRLDDTHLPHITLAQLFVREEEVDLAFEKIDETLRGIPPLHLTVTGGTKGANNAVSMAIDPTPELTGLHERLMDALRGVERPSGTPQAFSGGHARVGDVLWVSSYRLTYSFGKFSPHITLGHASNAPDVAPIAFTATTVAASHLGKFCTCHVVRRLWELQ